MLLLEVNDAYPTSKKPHRTKRRNSMTEDKKGTKAERKEQIMNEEKHVFYDPDGVVEFSEAVGEQVHEDLVWLSGFTREKYGLTIPEIRRLVAEMLTVSI